ncbi:MAG: FUSC family protein [Kofleriaceae bacterium]
MTPRFAVIAPDLSRGVRAAIAVVVPFYLAAQFDRPELAWLALGGWLGALADPTGTRRARVLAMTAFTLGSAAAIAIGGAIATTPIAAALFIATVAFVGSFARAINGPAGTIGNLIVLVAAIGAAPAAHPLQNAWLFAAGSLWAIGLSSIVWPGWPHLPFRIALADVFTTLADYCDTLDEATVDPRADWSALAREHQRRVRAALERAREMMLALRQRRSGETPVGTNLRVLLGDAELQLFRVIALADAVEAGADRHVLGELRETYRRISECLITREPGEPVHTNPITGSVLAKGLVEWARKAHARARDLDQLSSDDLPTTLTPAKKLATGQAVKDLRDAAHLSSPIFHHALRVGITCPVAYAIGRIASPTHSTWVTVTAIAVLQPYLGATLKRIVERVVGTIVGGAIAVLMMETITDRRVMAILMVPLAVGAVITRTKSYRLFVLLLTPVFVLVTDRWHPGIYTAGVRIADVALGGALAGIAAMIIPSSEKQRLPDALATMLDRITAYVEAYEKGIDLTVARREVGIALENAELSLERMLAEPKALRRGNADAVVLITYGRRMTAALTSLAETTRPTLPPALESDLLAAITAAKAHVTTGARIPRESARAQPAPFDKLWHYTALMRQIAVDG